MRKTLLTLLVVIATGAALAQEQNKDFYKLELTFRENALKAEKQSVGKTVQLNTHVMSIQKRNGKPIVLTGTVYNDGTEVYGDIFLAPSAVNTAMTLKPGDQIQVSGILKGRVVKSKDVLRISGYQSSVSGTNGSVYGGGGSTQGGTVTLSWPVYTIDKSSIKVIQTEAARLKALNDKQAAESKKAAEVTAAWNEARTKLDAKAAQRAIDLGLEKYQIDSTMNEIHRIDPEVAYYPQVVEFYKFLLKSGKADTGNAIAGSLDSRRPKLFAATVELGGLNFKFKFPNGDNILHFLIKEPTYAIRNDVSAKNLKMFFSEIDVEIIKTVVTHAQAAGLGDAQDQYGKTPKDYVQTAHRLSGGTMEKHFDAIKKLILEMK